MTENKTSDFKFSIEANDVVLRPAVDEEKHAGACAIHRTSLIALASFEDTLFKVAIVKDAAAANTKRSAGAVGARNMTKTASSM